MVIVPGSKHKSGASQGPAWIHAKVTGEWNDGNCCIDRLLIMHFQVFPFGCPVYFNSAFFFVSSHRFDRTLFSLWKHLIWNFGCILMSHSQNVSDRKSNLQLDGVAIDHGSRHAVNRTKKGDKYWCYYYYSYRSAAIYKWQNNRISAFTNMIQQYATASQTSKPAITTAHKYYLIFSGIAPRGYPDTSSRHSHT
jgi:hypothetical protein